MERTLFFTAHPSEEELNALAKGLQGPFSVEIRQEINNDYHEFLDCDTIAELHAFMCTGDYAVNDNEDFTVIIEEINPPPNDDDDHPSLTAAERNPSMVGQ
jgi:hypothetical protein